MSVRTASLLGYALVVACLLPSVGCALVNPGFPRTFTGPSLGWLGIPLPLSPYFQKKQEDRYWEDERYNRVPILGPITSGGPAVALDPPSPDEVVRAMPSIEGGWPFSHERQRNNVRMTIEPISDYVDPPRVYPLIGPAQLHHAHYKCTIYYTEITRVGYPVPYTTVDEDAQEVVYIDHNHLHMVGDVDDGTMPRQ